MCTHICAAGPLILSRHPPVKRWESTAGVPSAKFRALNAEQRAKETRCAPAKRQEFTAAVPSNFALVRLVSTSSPWATVHASCLAKIGACNFRALTAEKRAKETGDAPTNRLEITATMPSNFALVRLGEHQLALGHSTRPLPRKDGRL